MSTGDDAQKSSWAESGSQGVIGGMVNGCATYAQNEEEFLDEVTKTLAGRAGVSLIYGVMNFPLYFSRQPLFIPLCFRFFPSARA